MPTYDYRQISGPQAFFRMAFGAGEWFDIDRAPYARARQAEARSRREVGQATRVSRRAAAAGAPTDRSPDTRSETRSWNEARVKMRRLGIEEPQAPEEPEYPEADGTGIAELDGRTTEEVERQRAKLEKQHLERTEQYNRQSHIYEQQLRDLATQLRQGGTITDEQARRILEQARQKVVAPTPMPPGAEPAPRGREPSARTRIPEDLPMDPQEFYGPDQPGRERLGPAVPKRAPVPAQPPGAEPEATAAPADQPAAADAPGQPQPVPRTSRPRVELAAQAARQAMGVEGDAQEEAQQASPAEDVTGERNPVREARKAIKRGPSKTGSGVGIPWRAPADPATVFDQLNRGEISPQAVENRPKLVEKMVKEYKNSPKMQKAFAKRADAIRKEIRRETGIRPGDPISRGDRDRMAMNMLDRLVMVYPEKMVTEAWKDQIRARIKGAKGVEKQELQSQMELIREAEQSIEERRRVKMPTTANDLAKIVHPDPDPDSVMAEAEERAFTMAVPMVYYRYKGEEETAKEAEGIMAMRRKLAEDGRREVRELVKEAKQGDSRAQHKVIGTVLGTDSKVRERYESLGLPGRFPTIPVANQITGGLAKLVQGTPQERKTAAQRLYAYGQSIKKHQEGRGWLTLGETGLVGRDERQTHMAGVPSLQPLIGALRLAGVSVPDLSQAERRVALKLYGDEMGRLIYKYINRRSR